MDIDRKAPGLLFVIPHATLYVVWRMYGNTTKKQDRLSAV